MKNSEKVFELSLSKFGRFQQQFFRRQALGTQIRARIGKEEARLSKSQYSEKEDEEGVYGEWVLDYESAKDPEKTFTGRIECHSDYTVFETICHFEIKGKKRKHLFGNPYISFPSFEGEFEKGYSCLTFKRQAPFNYPEQWTGKAIDSLRLGKNSPLLITNESYETIIISPLTPLLYGTVAISADPKGIRCGIPRALHKIPKGYSNKTLLTYGYGVDATMKSWGRRLRDYYQVKEIRRDEDVLLKYISYWTNAGSAYWYKAPGEISYENILKKLRQHHRRIGISYGSYQLDSWWYKKEGDTYTSGIMEWEPKRVTRSKNFNSILPFIQKYKDIPLFSQDRMSYVQDILGTPIGCHFKQISKESVYVKKAPEDFWLDEFAIPKNQDIAFSLFKDIFTHPKWNMAYVIHDWLQFMNDRHPAFKDIEAGPAYFRGLDEACCKIESPANESGHLSLQFCMTQPHMTLNAVSMQSVTSIRSTSDSYSFFVEGTKRWAWHLYSSHFIQAIGKYAFYDNRKTRKTHSYPYSAYSVFEMVWLALGCGPIGIGDKMGRENTGLVKRVIKEDGEIIKPDVPSVPLDRCYLYNPHKKDQTKGVMTYTYTDLDSYFENESPYKVIYTLTFNCHPFGKTVDMAFRLEETGLCTSKDYAIYDYFSEKMQVVTSHQIQDYRLPRRKFYYHISAPLINGAALIGDISKHISASRQLIHKVSISTSKILLKLPLTASKEKAILLLYIEIEPKKIIINGQEREIRWKNKRLYINMDPLDIQTPVEEIEIRILR